MNIKSIASHDCIGMRKRTSKMSFSCDPGLVESRVTRVPVRYLRAPARREIKGDPLQRLVLKPMSKALKLRIS